MSQVRVAVAAKLGVMMPVAVGAMAALAKAGGAETDFRVSLGEIGAVALGTGDAGEGTPARSAVAGGAAPGPEAAVSADTGRSAGKVASAPGGKDAAPPSGKVAAAPSGKDVLPVLHSEVTGGVASDKPRAHTGLARAGVSAKEHGGSSAVKKTGDDIPIADSSSVPGSCALAVPASCVADTPAEPLAAGETAAEAPVGSAGGTAGQRPVAQARVQAAAGSKAPGGERFHPVNDEGAGSTDSAARPAGAPVELAGGVKVADGTSAETVAVAGKEHAGNVSLSAIGVTHAPPAEVVGGAVHDPHALPSRESQAPAAVAEPVPAADWPGEAKTLSATPQVLEVGVASGTHGWLRVRAELGHGGEVAASVVASSADAVKALHHELPGLSEYLAREQVAVASVAVSGNAVPAGESGMGAPSEQRSGREQAGQQASGAQAEGEPEPWVGAGGALFAAAMPLPPPLSGLNGGGWVNVRV